MIAVLGSDLDEAARDLVEAWSSQDTVLISARDLCTRGWAFRPSCGGDGWLVAGGIRRSVRELRGVVVRRPAVAAEELPWIADEDRQYVSAEINAFLVAWLAALPCPVLNRPSATSLCGPGWSQQHWAVAANRVGIPWSRSSGEGDLRDAVFCGTQHIGDIDGHQVQMGAALADASGATLFGVKFAGEAVAAVTLQPSLARDDVRAIVLAHLASRAAA